MTRAPEIAEREMNESPAIPVGTRALVLDGLVLLTRKSNVPAS
jgi:hypothetical protein